MTSELERGASEAHDLAAAQAIGLVCDHGVHAAAFCDICDADEEPHGI